MDSGMIVVILIGMGYLVMVFGLLFYVKNDWCDLHFNNMTVSIIFIKLFLSMLILCSGEHCLQTKELQEDGEGHGRLDWLEIGSAGLQKWVSIPKTG